MRAIGGINFLFDHQGEEEAQLGDEGGQRLNIHTVEVLLDQAELAEVVVAFAGHTLFSIRTDIIRQTGEETLFPALVSGINNSQQFNHAVEHSHREGSRTACRIKNAQFIDGLDNPVRDGGEVRTLVAVAELTDKLQVLPCCPVLLETGPEMQVERFIDHVVDDSARGIVRTGCFASALCCRLVGGIDFRQQVLEDQPE